MKSTAQETTAYPLPAGAATRLRRSAASPSTVPGPHRDHSHNGRFNATTVGWGFVVGVANAMIPLAIWRLDASTVHAFAITLIAAIYIGFAVADGRGHVIAVEVAVAASFVVLAMAAVTLSPWLLVAGYVGHGCKDLWQHRTQFVTGTRWWPPFCAVVDWTVATIIAIAILAGTTFH
jgi:hypothetical protein